jgi:hypothetical protein
MSHARCWDLSIFPRQRKTDHDLSFYFCRLTVNQIRPISPLRNGFNRRLDETDVLGLPLAP